MANYGDEYTAKRGYAVNVEFPPGNTVTTGTLAPTAPLDAVSGETGKALRECHAILDALTGPTPSEGIGPEHPPGLDGFTRNNLIATQALAQRLRSVVDRIGKL